jgi:hypothetical protein
VLGLERPCCHDAGKASVQHLLAPRRMRVGERQRGERQRTGNKVAHRAGVAARPARPDPATSPLSYDAIRVPAIAYSHVSDLVAAVGHQKYAGRLTTPVFPMGAQSSQSLRSTDARGRSTPTPAPSDCETFSPRWKRHPSSCSRNARRPRRARRRTNRWPVSVRGRAAAGASAPVVHRDVHLPNVLADQARGSALRRRHELRRLPH